MKESESLYYGCIDRIDKDIEVANMFLVGCITYVIRERGDTGIRHKIKEDLALNYYEPYIRELKLISNMCDRSIHALITSSIDLSCILKQVTIIHKHAIDTDYDLVTPSTHSSKAKKAADMLMELHRQTKPTTKKRTKVSTDSSLFSEGT